MLDPEICHVDRCPHGCTTETGCRGHALREIGPDLIHGQALHLVKAAAHGADGRMFTKSQQVHLIGNAVPPLLQQVVTAANVSDFNEPMRKAA